MDTKDDRLHRCREVVQAQNRAHSWGLTAQQEHHYAVALLKHMPQLCSEQLLLQMAWCYHHDHRFVTALQAPESLEGHTAWQRCRDQIPALLSYARLHWDIDSSADQDDLCQIGALAVFQALPQFDYRSHFVTWMFQVFRRSVLRVLRDRRAGKRFGPTDSYDQQPALASAMSTEMTADSTTHFNMLVALIDEILAGDRDQRLQFIFHLWAFKDARLADIGRITGLSQSRVSILIERARNRLRQDQRIQEWFGEMPDHIPSAQSSPSANPQGDTSPSTESSPTNPPTDDDPPQISEGTN